MIEALGTDGYVKADGDWMLLKQRGRPDMIAQPSQIDMLVYRPAGRFSLGSLALTLNTGEVTVRFRRGRQEEFLRLLAHLEEHNLRGRK